MNKVSLLTLGKKLQDGNLYVLSVYDVEPSGLIIHAYDQINSKEYSLPISEFEFLNAAYSRRQNSLRELVDTVDIFPVGSDFLLRSSDERISNIKQRLLGEDLIEMTKRPINGSKTSLNSLIVEGLVELSKVKPVGLDAVRWLGQWLLANNPSKPCVMDPDDD